MEEDLVAECRILLLTVALQVDIDDVWIWTPDPVDGYSISGAYRLFTDRRPPSQFVPVDLLWRREVPLKVSGFAWRLFRSPLPTKVNLFRRRIIPSEAQWCVTGCDIQESENHLYLNCGVFGQIWPLVRNWLGVCATDPSNVMDLFFSNFVLLQVMQHLGDLL